MKLKIRDKFIIYATLILFLLISLFTFSILEFEKQSRRKVLDEKMSRTMRILATINKIPVWNVDYKVIKKNFTTYLEDQEVVRILILDKQKEKILDVEDNYNSDDVIVRKKRVEYQEKTVGTLKVYFSKYYLNEELDRIRNRLLLWGLGVYIVVLGIIVIISNMVTDPINKLAHNIHSIDFNNPEEINTGLERTDIQEVDMLLSSYQEMVSELSAAFEELEAQSETLNQSYREVEQVNKNLREVINLSSSLSQHVFSDAKEEFLADLLQKAHDLVPEADYGSIYLIEEGKINYIDTIGHDLENLKKLDLKKDNFKINDQDLLIVENISKQMEIDMGVENYNKFQTASQNMKSSLLFKLRVNDQWSGGISLDIDAASEEEFSTEAIETISGFGNLASAFLTMRSHRDFQEKFQQELIMSFIKLLELYDKYTKGHSQSVANISAKIAEKMNLNPEKINLAYWSGMLHDIGKILVDKDILNKPTKLSAEEYEKIKKHSNYGYQVLKNSSSAELRNIAKYIRHHHERWDGGGYPSGLNREEIPLISQIISVADTWNTMRTDRPYREKLSRKVAIEELEENIGTQFAPEVVKSFLELLNGDKKEGLCII